MALRRLGYPCIRAGSDTQTVKRCRKHNATNERLRELIQRNLQCLRDVLEYNLQHNIQFFRIHSDTIPFASHPEVQFDGLAFAEDQLETLGDFIQSHDIRVSMHPGQYTVLNSKDESVVDNARRNLQYHARFLDALGVDHDAKIILHIGGVYGNRSAAMERFSRVANNLSDSVQNRLVIEHDEQSYHIRHVLELHEATGLPVVFDWLHHQFYAPEPEKSMLHWMQKSFETWSQTEGPPIVHFSSPGTGSGGHHADRINADDFQTFLERTRTLDPFDVMLECKDKEVALHELINQVSWDFRERQKTS